MKNGKVWKCKVSDAGVCFGECKFVGCKIWEMEGEKRGELPHPQSKIS
jgi:hypothetical protein